MVSCQMDSEDLELHVSRRFSELTLALPGPGLRSLPLELDFQSAGQGVPVPRSPAGPGAVSLTSHGGVPAQWTSFLGKEADRSEPRP